MLILVYLCAYSNNMVACIAAFALSIAVKIFLMVQHKRKYIQTVFHLLSPIVLKSGPSIKQNSIQGSTRTVLISSRKRTLWNNLQNWPSALLFFGRKLNWIINNRFVFYNKMENLHSGFLYAAFTNQKKMLINVLYFVASSQIVHHYLHINITLHSVFLWAY